MSSDLLALFELVVARTTPSTRSNECNIINIPHSVLYQHAPTEEDAAQCEDRVIYQ